MSLLLSAVTTTGAGAGVAPTVPHEITACQCTVAGTGSVSATVNLEASLNGSAWSVVATFTLSGTTSASDSTTFYTAYSQYRGNVTAISGTGAAVTMGIGV